MKTSPHPRWEGAGSMDYMELWGCAQMEPGDNQGIEGWGSLSPDPSSQARPFSCALYFGDPDSSGRRGFSKEKARYQWLWKCLRTEAGLRT